MAAPARSFHEIFIDQYEHLATVGEYEWDQMNALYDRWRDRIDRIRQGEYAFRNSVDQQVVADIADWLTSR